MTPQQFEELKQILLAIRDAVRARSPSGALNDFALSPPSTACGTCGIDFQGQITGYVCPRLDCPHSVRIT